MDRQKNIPPLSTKITRKLAQESADHNSLMNFYSSISRDETGAPKKWKMSSPLMIDEDSITSKKAGSNKSTPTGSRENSNERRRHQSASSSKSSRGGRRKSHSRDGSSSEQNSSRESSLDNRDNTKDTPVVKKKRGRPKSLDLKDKLKLKEVNMANGDSDNFKSPDPLTPCNITVKRKKGRPKETPPVLVAEAPVEALNTEKEVEKEEEKEEEIIFSEPEEQPIEPIEVKRKPGRPRKKIKAMLNTDKLKSLSKGDKMKPFGMKRFEGKSLKTYGSKIIKKKVQRGFRKFRKISNHDLDKTEIIDNDNVVLSKEGEDVMVDKKLEIAQLNEVEDITIKKRPGRPPKNKKKSFFNTLTIMKAKNKGGRPPGSKNKPKFNPVLLQRPLNRGPGRPPGAKNKEKSVERKTEVTGNGTETELVSVKSSPNENSVEIKKEEVVDSTTDKSSVVLPAVADDIEKEIQLPSPVAQTEMPKPVINDTFNAVDEAIEAVVCKARSDEPFEVKTRPRGHFKSAMFYKRQPTNLSLAKSKKQKDIVEKIRKKQILKVHETNSELIFDNSHLASNDLRRKLHSKLIEKMSLLNKTGKMNVSGAKPDEIENSDSVSEINKEPFQTGESSSNPEDNQQVGETQNMGVNEDKTVVGNVEIAEKTSKLPRRGRKSSLDITKFSDTESICSELSSNSFASVKRPVDKQILILGEDNIDSDDSTVRTRQRFEIIPGKKRKRTLSGEFDLLDEKQLRKQKKKDEKDQSDEESETVQNETVPVDGLIGKPKFKRMKSPMTKSKHFKIKDGKVSKKTTSQYIIYKNRLLKQSPFLNKNRKKKRKVLIKRKHEEKTMPLVNAQKDVSSKDTDNSSSTVETSVTKPDSYRTGLFEKFSNDSNESLLLSEALKESSNKVDDAKSDDTESTIELKDMLSEDQDEMPVEESVDDSDTFNFHAEDDTESAGKELYTDSEIDVREMLFDIIDYVVNNCEVKTTENMKDLGEKSVLKIGCPSKEESTINTTLDKNIQSEIVKSGQPEDISENNLEKTENTNKHEISESIKNDENKEKVIETVTRKKPGRKPKNVSQSSNVKTPQANIQKVINADGTERIRKKPGRKPKPKVNKDAQEQTLCEEDKSPVPKAALNIEASSSPEGATRKFELRQKISRSPLDNIALKQSLEENEYLKSEAQRVSRKEAKWKSKLKATNQESVESLITPVNEEEFVENEMQETDSYESDEEEIQEKVTIEDLIKDCKPCKVILKDFIKELERTQGDSDSSESEMFGEDSQGSSDVDRYKSPVKLKDSNELDLSRTSDLDGKINDEALIEINQKNENVCNETDGNMKSELGNTYLKKEELLKQDGKETICSIKGDVVDRDTIETNCHDSNIFGQKEIKMGNQGEKKNSVDEFKDENKDSVDEFKLKQTEKKLDLPENANVMILNDATSSDFKDIKNDSKTNILDNANDLKQTKKNVSPLKREAKLKEPKPKRKSPIKSKVAEEIKDKQQKPISPYKKQKVHTSYEQQTARKTVPPLKIKVKDAYSSRRKTYMVEPSPDSPVESTDMLNKPEPKHEKKSKFKSGNKSESSDSEKHKGHHHKRKNKSPSVEISAQSKLNLNDAPKHSNKLVTDKPLIKATDAYEANFLQFIQDKDKVEQNIAAFSSSLGQKNKLHTPKNKDGRLSAKHKNNTKFLNQEALTPPQDEKSNDSDSNDVQYVCSQCDDIVYRAKDDIVRHYAEVHPGHQFIYKPLPDTSSENSNSQTDVNSNEKKEDESPAPERLEDGMPDKTSIEENPAVEEDDDAGSLNLKIVEVVSLKDQNNIHDSEMLEISKSENERLQISGTEAQVSASHIQVSVPQLVTSQILQQPVIRTNDGLMNQIHLNQIHAQLAANQMQANNNLHFRLASNQNLANPVQTELKIPTFSVLNTTMSPSYSFIASKPPPPYSAHTMSIQTPLSIPGLVQTNAPVSLMNNFTNQVQLPSQPKVRPPLNAGKLKSPSQPGKLGNTFKCEKCNVHAPMLAAMVAHLRNCHKEIPRLFQCPYCKDMEAENEAQIHQHIKKNHPSNNPNPPVALSEPAKRNLKTLNIKLPDNLKLGEGNNIEKDIYMCLKCKEHRPSLETIYEHLEQHHADVFAYVCPMCKVFKSPLEDLVNKHISNDHGQNPSSVSLSLAIDGNHFSRVQCLIKDKQKSSQKTTVSPVTSKQTSPVLSQHNGRAAVSVPGQQNSEAQHLLDTPHSTEQLVLKPSLNAVNSFAALQQQSKTPSPGVTSKPMQQPNQKKKKTLLESIEKLTVQKLEEQGLLGSKSESSSPVIPSHPSQLQGPTNTTPPPLMRGPPPLIRYDQLNKMPSAHTALLTSTLKTSSQFAALNPATSLALKSPSSLQRLQNMTNTTTLPTQLNTTARPIQSSLFDTSDLDQVKSPQNQRPVLNVPVVPRMANQPSHVQNLPIKSKEAPTTTGAPLDLSKTPSPSPIPQNVVSPNVPQMMGGGGINPEIFKVFNIRPSPQMQIPRPQGQMAQQMAAQPIMTPQQVRQNTPSTLAYRPPVPQMITTSQMPQFISMPVGTVILSNVTPQGIPTFPLGTTIPGLQTAQFVRMTTPQVSASGAGTTMIITSSQSAPATALTSIPKSVSAQPFPKNMLFKCPYCPKVVPLRLDQVKPHIENQHPGSAILFQQFETK